MLTNLKYEGSTLAMLDRLDLIRKRLVDLAKKDDERAYNGIYDKVLVIDFLDKWVRAGRIEKTEEKLLELFL